MHGDNPVPLPCTPATDLCNGVDHGCEFKCVTSEGSYHCVCPEGQQLQADGKGCSREYRDAALSTGVQLTLWDAVQGCSAPSSQRGLHSHGQLRGALHGWMRDCIRRDRAQRVQQEFGESFRKRET